MTRFQKRLNGAINIRKIRQQMDGVDYVIVIHLIKLWVEVVKKGEIRKNMDFSNLLIDPHFIILDNDEEIEKCRRSINKEK